MLRAMALRRPHPALHARVRTVLAPNLHETALTVAPTVLVVAAATARTVVRDTPVPLLRLARNLDGVNHILQRAPGVCDLESGGQHHLNRTDERHGRVVACGVGVAVCKAGLCHESLETCLIAGVPGTGLTTQLLGIDGLDDGVEHSGIDTDGLREHAEVIGEGMAQDDDGAVAESRVGRVDGPLEHAVDHLLGIGFIDEAGLTEAVPVLLSEGFKCEKEIGYLLVWVANAELDVEQVRVLFNTRMVEVDLLENLLAVVARVLQSPSVTAIKGCNAELGELLVIVCPALRVETDDNHVVCQCWDTLEFAETKRVLHYRLG
jgi:hypothetical protein